jgi:hypothetical protein
MVYQPGLPGGAFSPSIYDRGFGKRMDSGLADEVGAGLPFRQDVHARCGVGRQSILVDHRDPPLGRWSYMEVLDGNDIGK